jgi:hypothetical protein
VRMVSGRFKARRGDVMSSGVPDAAALVR